MSNDPKDAVVDLSKLVKSPTPTSRPMKTSSDNKSTTSTLLTSLNESADMIGRENFTKNDGKTNK